MRKIKLLSLLAALVCATSMWATDYYVVGSMTDWQTKSSYKMSENPSASGEYMWVGNFSAYDQFKVTTTSDGTWPDTWFPSEGPNYGEYGEISAGGTYTVYFRPGNDGGSGWYYNCIYVAEGAPVVNHSIALADGIANADKVSLNVASAAEGATITLTPIAGWEITSFRALSLDNEATEAAFTFAEGNSVNYNGTYITGWSRYSQYMGAGIGESYATDVTFTAKDENAVILRVDANANTTYGSPAGTSVSSGNFSYTSSAIHVTNVKAHSLNMQKNSAGNYYISSITVQVATLRELASAKNDATGAYSFEMSDANVMIEATIAPQYSIDLSGIEHVTISQAAAAAGNTVVVTPEAGYKITAFTASHMEDRYNIYINGDEQEELNVALPRNVGVYTPVWDEYPIENVHLSGGDGKVSIAGQGFDDVTIRVTDAFSGTATVYYTVRWCDSFNDEYWECESEGTDEQSFSVACSATAPGQVNLSSSKNDVTGAYSFTMPAHDVTITATVEVDPDYAPSEFDITANEDPQHAGVYYSTFYHSGADYTLPAGVEAFKAAISGDALNLTKVAEASEAIPAGNAVILKSDNQNYTLTASAATTSSYSENSLQGTNAAINTPSNCYVLSGESSDHSVTGVGFYQYTGAKVGAHKAYIQWGGSGAPKRMRFVFNEENTATAVENANVEGKSVKFIENGQFYILRNGVRYNAQGQIIK